MATNNYQTQASIVRTHPRRNFFHGKVHSKLVSVHAVMLYTRKSGLFEYIACTDLGAGAQYLEPILLLIMCACVYGIQDFLKNYCPVEQGANIIISPCHV